jgi:glucose/arabinose dehydrogenase
MAFAPDGRLFITEQGGSVRVVKGGVLRDVRFVSLPVDPDGERGLLGVAFHPNFPSNGFVYVYHTVPGAPARNRVSRLTARGDVAVSGSRVTILDLENLSSARNHNGGAIHFGPDGKLYVAVGENNNGANAQALTNRLGKILRVNADGSIPPDNPTSFPGISGHPLGANRAIWAVGLRNPFSFAFQPHSGTMLINDVGAGTFEEVNRGQRGRNYGWPDSEGATSDPDFTGPIYAYRHRDGTPIGCAITGGAFYNPRRVVFPSSYVGKYFFADYCRGWIYYLNPATPDRATPFQSGLNAPVAMAVGSDGALYYAERGSGQVRRIRYSSESPQGILASTGQLEIGEGDRAQVAVKLATRPSANVTVSVRRNLSDQALVASKSALTFTRDNWNVAQILTITAAPDANRTDEGARFGLAAPGIPGTQVWVTAIDDDRPAGFPRASISLPRNSDVVSGATAEFFGDNVGGGTIVKAEFLVDGDLLNTDAGIKDHSGYPVGSA